MSYPDGAAAALEDLARLDHIEKAVSDLGALPDPNLFSHLRGALKALYGSKVAPYQPGDRVRLTKAPDYEQAPGWKHCEHFLVPGALATVRHLWLGEDGWEVHVVFDGESWIPAFGPDKGKPQLAADGRRHTFRFRPDSLERVKDGGPDAG